MSSLVEVGVAVTLTCLFVENIKTSKRTNWRLLILEGAWWEDIDESDRIFIPCEQVVACCIESLRQLVSTVC